MRRTNSSAWPGRPVWPHYGRDVYIRGLIEFTNYCRNDCYYCGIRKSNGKIRRYRLTEDVILACCRQGYELGFRTFVLQGRGGRVFHRCAPDGPHPPHQEGISGLRHHPLRGGAGAGLLPALFDAGADRYLLRHETYDESHYARLHPPACTPRTGRPGPARPEGHRLPGGRRLHGRLPVPDGGASGPGTCCT